MVRREERGRGPRRSGHVGDPKTARQDRQRCRGPDAAGGGGPPGEEKGGGGGGGRNQAVEDRGPRVAPGGKVEVGVGPTLELNYRVSLFFGKLHLSVLAVLEISTFRSLMFCLVIIGGLILFSGDSVSPFVCDSHPRFTHNCRAISSY